MTMRFENNQDDFAQTYVHGNKVGNYDDENAIDDWAGKKVFVNKTIEKLASDNVEIVMKASKSALLVDLSNKPRFFRVVSAGTSDFSMYEKEDIETAKRWLQKHKLHCEFQYGGHILVKDKNVLSKDKQYKTKTFSNIEKPVAKAIGFNTHGLNIYWDDNDKNSRGICPVCNMEKINGTCDCD